MNAATIVTLLDDLLDSAVAELTAPPARRFVAHGEWAHDCECVTSRVVEWTFAPESRVADYQVADYPVINQITLAVAVLRCYPSPQGGTIIPAAADLTTATNTLARDLAELTEGLSTRWAAGTLFPSVSPNTLLGAQVGWVGARPIGPEGEFAGWEATLLVRA